MRKRNLLLAVGACLAALALSAGSAMAAPNPAGSTVRVCPTGIADFTTITGALASPTVTDGTTLELCAATFAEGPLTISKSVTVRGVGSNGTIITSASPVSATHSVITVPTAPPVQVAISGLRITGGATTCVCGGGLTIGDANGPFPRGDTGHLTLANVLIDHNQGGDGGGLFNVGGNLAVSGSVIRDNTTNGPESGGVSVFLGTNSFVGTTISGNSDNRGGGVYLANNTNATFDHDNVSNNTSVRGGGGIFVSGGTNTLTVTNSAVTGNTADTGGPGGLFGASGGGIGAEGTIVLSRTVVSGNTAIAGGGIWSKSTVTIDGGVIANNVAQQDGGGFWDNFNSAATISRTLITGNRAAQDGGGLWHGAAPKPLTLQDSLVQGNHADSEGGGLYNEGTDPLDAVGATARATLTRTPVVANTAPAGGGIQNEGVLVLNQSPVVGNRVGNCVDESPGTGCPSFP